MSISLRKGGNISLTKEGGSSLNKVTVGLGWDPRVTDGTQFDLDASVFCLNPFGKVRSDADFVFYNQPQLPNGSIVYGGDNLTGDGDGDDEQVFITLQDVPSEVHKVAICVSIYDGQARRQNFGMVANAFVRVVDDNNGRELARYDLSEDMSMETAMIFAEVYRHNNEWKFKAIGQGFNGGLETLARNFGVNV